MAATQLRRRRARALLEDREPEAKLVHRRRYPVVSFQEIYKAAIEEIRSEADAIRTELSQLYLALESGSIAESEFDDRERELLDRLDEIEDRGMLEDDEDDEDDDDSDDEYEDEFDDEQLMGNLNAKET